MKYIKVKTEDHVAIMSIDRPKALNALSRDIVDEMDAELDRIEEDESIRVLVLYSEGNFAAGADIKQMVDCNEEEAKAFAFSSTFNKLEDLRVPTIALIEGYALGGGLELALACDMRIASEDAKMGFPEINLGIMPGAGGTIRAARLIGPALAKELIFTGRNLGAEEARSMGLVNSVTAKDALLETGLKMASRIAGKAPIAVRTAKKTIDAGLENADVKVGIDIEAANWASLFNTADQKEGMKAFIEKRKPEYTGK